MGLLATPVEVKFVSLSHGACPAILRRWCPESLKLAKFPASFGTIRPIDAVGCGNL
jgi:hypothetical protein